MSENYNDIKISVIVPVYNVEKYIRYCIDSVLSQTYHNFEVILVDDGSTDNSPNICDEYAHSDSRVHVIHKENGGLSSARNAGLDTASGDYVLFLDSDDYYSNNCFFEHLIKIAAQNYDIVVFGHISIPDEQSPVIPNAPFMQNENATHYMVYPDSIVSLLDYGLYIASACDKLVKRKLLTDNHIRFEEKVFSEDIEWCAKLIPAMNSIGYLNEYGYVYRQRKGSITHSKKEKNIVDLKNIVTRCIQNISQIQNEKIKTAYSAYIAYQYATIIITCSTMGKGSYAYLSDVKQYANILGKSNNKRIRILHLINKIFGFKALFLLARMFTMIKK